MRAGCICQLSPISRNVASRHKIMKKLFLSLCFLLIPSLTLAQDVMEFVYYDNYSPRSWVENGKTKGILVDIVEEALVKRLGIAVSHSGYPWKRAQKMVQENGADAFVTVSTKERRAYTVTGTEPAIVFNIHLLVRKDYAGIRNLEQVSTLEELKGIKIADYSGNGWAERKLQGMNVHWLPNIDVIFPFILAGRADAALVSNRTIYKMKQLGYSSQFTILPNILESVSFYICIGKNSPFKGITDDLDKALKEMHNDGTIDHILEKYYN